MTNDLWTVNGFISSLLLYLEQHYGNAIYHRKAQKGGQVTCELVKALPSGCMPH